MSTEKYVCPICDAKINKRAPLAKAKFELHLKIHDQEADEAETKPVPLAEQIESIKNEEK